MGRTIDICISGPCFRRISTLTAVPAYAGLIEELYYKSRHSRSECDSIIKYAELSLQDNPFDLRQINFMIYALREKQKQCGQYLAVQA